MFILMKTSNTRLDIKKQMQLSKIRCDHQYGMHPHVSRPIMRLQTAELSKHRQQFFEHINESDFYFDKTSILPDKSRYSFVISDATGAIVESYSPDGYETEFRYSGITPGGVFSEQIAGTNGVSMALHMNGVVTVSDTDHFYRCFYGFSCSTSPLYNAQNKLIGTISLVGSAKRRIEEIILCENILKRAAYQFQARLFRQYHSKNITARLKSLSQDGLIQFETMAACDDRGHVIASIPLWRDGQCPENHQNIEGRHLSEFHDVAIDVRGPAIIPTLQKPVQSARISQPPIHTRPGKAMRHYIKQEGGLATIVDRVEKLVSHRIPLLLCGESDIGKSDFAQTILEDLNIAPSFVYNIYCLQDIKGDIFSKILNDVRSLCEYPVQNCTPTLILHKVDHLSEDNYLLLEKFLHRMDPSGDDNIVTVQPILIVTVDQTWGMITDGGIIPKNLLYFLGQSIIELPPLRKRKLRQVINYLTSKELNGKLEISMQAMALLTRYDWLGNLREMRAVCPSSYKLEHIAA